MTSPQLIAPQEAGKPVVFERHGRAETNSQHVAACFEKRHADVIRGIRSLVATEPSLSERNFAFTEYADSRGKMHPAYDMDRDGFTLIAMGFTGPKALRFKMAYIAEFNRMEAALHAPAANDDAPDQDREFSHWPMDEIRAKRGVVEMYRMTYGPPIGPMDGSPAWFSSAAGWAHRDRAAKCVTTVLAHRFKIGHDVAMGRLSVAGV